MAKSIKFKNDVYLDSTSIMHNRNSLDKVLDDNNLIVKYVLSSDSNSFTIENLNLKDGIYDIYVDGVATTKALLNMHINNKASISQELIEGEQGNVIASNQGGQSRLGVMGTSSTFIVAHMIKRGSHARVIATGGYASLINVTIQETNVGDVIDTLKFQVHTGNIHANALVSIYKRQLF